MINNVLKVGVLGLLFVNLLACSENPEKTTEIKLSETKEYQKLSLLMLEMWNNENEIKQTIIEGKPLNDGFKEKFADIHITKTSNEKTAVADKAIFLSLGSVFTTTLNDVYVNNKSSKNFKKMVRKCVNCHKSSL